MDNRKKPKYISNANMLAAQGCRRMTELEEEASQYANEDWGYYDPNDYKKGWYEAYKNYIETYGDV